MTKNELREQLKTGQIKLKRTSNTDFWFSNKNRSILLHLYIENTFFKVMNIRGHTGLVDRDLIQILVPFLVGVIE